jgi:hypothetical protein
VRSLSLDHGALDSHVIDLAVIVSLLLFVLEIGIRASSDGMDCAIGEEIVALIRRFVHLQRRWWGQIMLYIILKG